MSSRLFATFAQWVINRAVFNRGPDFVIGGHDDPYMLRWWLTPWSRVRPDPLRSQQTPWVWFCSRLPGLYLHRFLRSDDDRALHDHPWANASLILEGSYTEHTIDAGGINRRHVLRAGDISVRLSGKHAHRVELHDGPCWTLFFTGWRYREWGFHCPERGWVPWKDFVDAADKGNIGKGCGA